jgi:hypothetical protein
MGFLDTDTETKAELYLDDGDHERYAHYAEKNEITEALVNGVPVVALCGKIWVPSRDPKKFPICPMCKEIHDALFIAD